MLTLKVQPGASHDQWLGRHGDLFRVRICAPPVDGRANTQLIKYLASLFGVNRSRITLLSGDTGRHKRLRIAAPASLPTDIRPPE